MSQRSAFAVCVVLLAACGGPRDVDRNARAYAGLIRGTQVLVIERGVSACTSTSESPFQDPDVFQSFVVEASALRDGAQVSVAGVERSRLFGVGKQRFKCSF